MRHVWTALFFLVVGVILLAEHSTRKQASPLAPTQDPSAATAPDSSAATAPKEETPACTSPTPRPSLQKAAYSDYHFEQGPENAAMESASTGTLHIEIQYAGCYEGLEHAYIFDDANPLADYTDRDHWLFFAAQKLNALAITPHAREDIDDLVPFLDRAKTATTRMNDSEVRLEVCRDGSAPTKKDDGCSFESGGGYRFAVRKLPKQHIGVYVSRYYVMKSAPPKPAQ